MQYPVQLRKSSIRIVYMVDHRLEVKTHSVEQTRQLGQDIGRLIKQPLIIALIGDLGSGKTAWVQGLAQGLEVPAGYYITSPTFTLINEYPGRLPLFHADLYRLETVSDLADIGLEELFYEQGVLAVEWADKLTENPSDDYLNLRIEIIDDDCRKISLIANGQNGINLIKALEI